MWKYVQYKWVDVVSDRRKIKVYILGCMFIHYILSFQKKRSQSSRQLLPLFLSVISAAISRSEGRRGDQRELTKQHLAAVRDQLWVDTGIHHNPWTPCTFSVSPPKLCTLGVSRSLNSLSLSPASGGKKPDFLLGESSSWASSFLFFSRSENGRIERFWRDRKDSPFI